MSGTDAAERLARDTAALVREQVRRLSGDLAGSVRQAEGGTLLLAGAGTCGLLSLLAAHQTAVRALETVLPRPAATGILAFVYAAAGASLAIAGLDQLRRAEETGDEVVERAAETGLAPPGDETGHDS